MRKGRDSCVAVTQVLSLARKRTGPRARPSTATYLPPVGTDFNTIRTWLGHVILATTTVYAGVEFGTRARAIAY